MSVRVERKIAPLFQESPILRGRRHQTPDRGHGRDPDPGHPPIRRNLLKSDLLSAVPVAKVRLKRNESDDRYGIRDKKTGSGDEGQRGPLRQKMHRKPRNDVPN